MPLNRELAANKKNSGIWYNAVNSIPGVLAKAGLKAVRK